MTQRNNVIFDRVSREAGIVLFIAKKVAQTLLLLMVTLLIAVMLAFAFNLTVNLSRFTPLIASTVESYTGLRILFDGELSVTLGQVPEVQLEGLRWQKNEEDEIPFLQLGHSELSVDFTSLFDEEVIVKKVQLSALALNLVAKEGEGLNIPELDLMVFLEWLNQRVETLPPFIADDIQLTDLSFRLLAPEKSLKGQFTFDQIDAKWGWNSPLWLMGEGTIDDANPKPITISANGGAFRTLGDASEKWVSSVNVAGNKADISTQLILSGDDSAGLKQDEHVLAKNREYELFVQINHLPYGDLLLYLGLQEPMKGELNASVFLQGDMTNLDQPLIHSTGTIELAVWPDNLHANPLDFWAVNIINLMFSHLNEDSKVNCAVARFDLSDGALSSDVMIFDTSRLRVYGNGTFNLADRELDFWVDAKAKQVQWLSKEVPVRIKGTLDKPEIEFEKMGVFKSTVKSVVNFTLPLLPVLINDTMESDGSKDCLQSMQASRGRIKE